MTRVIYETKDVPYVNVMTARRTKVGRRRSAARTDGHLAPAATDQSTVAQREFTQGQWSEFIDCSEPFGSLDKLWLSIPGFSRRLKASLRYSPINELLLAWCLHLR